MSNDAAVPLEAARLSLVAATEALARARKQVAFYEASNSDGALAVSKESELYWRGYHAACVRAVADLEEWDRK